jgi:cellulose synthase/poly-beta-1,6-N-acetylglucosamine synthase-like glycosyltransferase
MMKIFKISILVFIAIAICFNIYVTNFKTITDRLDPFVNSIYTFYISMVTFVTVIIYLITLYIKKPIVRLILMFSAYFLFVYVTTIMLKQIFFPGYLPLDISI